MRVPNKLDAKAHALLFNQGLNAIVKFEMGHGDAASYHDLLVTILIAQEAAKLVGKHKHLTPYFEDGVGALASVNAHANATGHWQASQEELDVLHGALQLAKAIFKTTHPPVIRRAMLRLMNEMGVQNDLPSE